jgi:hypothetical protein
MILVNVVEDDTMPVPGFEWRTFMCSACDDVERRLVFTKHTVGGEPDRIQVSPPVAGEQSETGEEDPDPVQEAPPLAGEQTDNEPLPGEGKPEPAQVASFLASEQSDNKPMPVEGGPELAPALVGEQSDNEPMPTSEGAPIAPASTTQDKRALTPHLFRRVIAKVRGR